MEINIENHPRSIKDLFFTDSTSSSIGLLTCLGTGQQKLNKIVIPIYQRKYDWAQDELYRLLDNTNDYINTSGSTPLKSSYFTGTILLEKSEKNDGEYELIDGQQRLTSAYLLTFVGYLCSIYRYNNLPNFSGKKLIIEKYNRYIVVRDFEKKLFNYNSHSVNKNWSEVFLDKLEDLDDDALREQAFEKRFNMLELLANYSTKLDHQDTTQKDLFINCISKTTIELNSKGEINLNDIRNNEFNERTVNIFNYFKKIFVSSNNDDILYHIIERIDLYSDSIAFCVLVSLNTNDSFKLFEVLNSTGRPLTIIDKLKSFLYTDIVIVEKSLTSEKFNQKWSELIEILDGTGNKINLTLDLTRSELSTIKDKYYEYYSDKKSIIRREIFKKESSNLFFDRIIYISKLLNEIFDKDCYDSNTNSHSLEWYAKIIQKLNYDWGRQVILGANILSGYLNEASVLSNNKEIWKLTGIDDYTKLNKQTELTKFYVILYDLLLKVGIIGIINGLTSDKLPKISQKILNNIIDFVEQNRKKSDLKILINNIIDECNSYINNNKSDFIINIKNLTYSKTTDRKLMTILLFILYNRGKGNSFQFENPSLEHFECSNIPSGQSKGYYNGSDRDVLINSIGNMLLMKKNINSKLGNNTIKGKLEIIERDLKKEVFFSQNIFLNLLPNTDHIEGTLNPYSNFPEINFTKGYNKDFEPQKELFESRTEFYCTNLEDMICNTKKYILSGDNFVLPK
jgi:uncharacterized protein with ParB-like and HNH nuclease domain